MNKIVVKLLAVISVALLMSPLVQADEVKSKRELKNSMRTKTNILPGSVDNLADAFTEGMLYGRLRLNTFSWDWKSSGSTDLDDSKALGLGGSLVYNTARYKGFSAKAGLFYSDSPFSNIREDSLSVDSVKAGKDTFSRYKVANGGDYSMAVLAQAYLRYKYSKTSVIVGRQIFESFITKSNDTKMIPNTFEGVVLRMTELPKTRIRGAYFSGQKLRDHTEFHDVLTYDDGSGNTYSSWNNNDDSSVHKGLSYANFTAAGEDTSHELIIVDLRNKSVENLQVDLTYASVPDVLSSITGELNYKIKMGNYSLTPGVRYMQQMDNGGGAIGGATLRGDLARDATPTSNLGYKERYTLDSSLAMTRLVLRKGALKAQIAYSAVADEADIVAPWRGFPTSGYTRAMAQYNWRANTKSTAAEVRYDFNKAGLIPGFKALIRYVIQDFDEAKQVAGIQTDSNIIHADLQQNITKDLYAKVRIGLVSADAQVQSGIDMNSYNEYRFELNYLF